MNSNADDRRDRSLTDGSGDRPTRDARRSLLLAHASAAVALGGVQGILPALPEIQAALDLSDAQIGLVNSAYLLPGVLLAIPAGFLVDRIGRRRMYVLACLLFGLAGGAVLLAPPFEILLLLRLLQGTAFATLLPLSVTLVGDLLTGPAQVREQSYRMLVITGSDTLLPLLGGVLVVLAWQAPFALHLAGLPLAALGWVALRVPGSTPGEHRPLVVRDLLQLLRTRVAAALQSLGVLRFVFKFAVLTYAPILLSHRGVSTALIAVGLAAMAGVGVLAALATPWLLRSIRGSVVLLISLCMIALGFVLLALVEDGLALVAVLLLFGAAEGAYGIVINAMTLEGVDGRQRATFVATVGALRNLGKFLAPSLLGLAVLWIPLSVAFAVVGIAALLTLLLVPSLRGLDGALRGEGDEGE